VRNESAVAPCSSPAPIHSRVVPTAPDGGGGGADLESTASASLGRGVGRDGAAGAGSAGAVAGILAGRRIFAGLAAGLAGVGIPAVDGILADLGVSSMQLDDPERGFTFKDDGPLDLRMNPQRGRPASEWLSRVTPEALATALRDNADEPMAGPLAEALAASVRERPVTRTRDLARRLHDLYRERRWTRDKAEGDGRVRRVFQALRIEVNDEFGVLEALLRQVPSCLRPGGRVAILTFHSGEDRRVKRAFLEGQRQGLYEVVSDSVRRPGPEELRSNPRSAPAKLRWAVRSAR